MEISLTKYENIHGVTVQEAYKKNVKRQKDGRAGDDEDGANGESGDDEEK